MNNTGIGYRSGRLVIIGIARENKRGIAYVCKCDCGNVVQLSRSNIYGTTSRNPNRSCGCHRHKQENLIKEYPRLYDAWKSMKNRCHEIKNHKSDTYIKNNITVCDDWINSFKSFLLWSIDSGYNDSLTLDRINNNDGYSPENCRWVDSYLQAQNRGILKNNKTGFTGVCKHKNGYRSYIMRDGTRKHLGLYKNIEDAINARKIAESQYDLGKGS